MKKINFLIFHPFGLPIHATVSHHLNVNIIKSTLFSSAIQTNLGMLITPFKIIKKSLIYLMLERYMILGTKRQIMSIHLCWRAVDKNKEAHTRKQNLVFYTIELLMVQLRTVTKPVSKSLNVRNFEVKSLINEIFINFVRKNITFASICFLMVN